jgi:hypothetical protein
MSFERHIVKFEYEYLIIIQYLDIITSQFLYRMSLVKTSQQLVISAGNALTKQFKGFNIRVRDADGYIHATDMCKVGKKRWNDYYTNKRNKEFFEELSSTVGIPTVKLIESMEGRNGGTWVHPRIATHLAMWISPEFAVKVTGWVEQWRLTKLKNNDEWISSLKNLKISKSFQKEKEIQLKYQKELNAQIEIKSNFGYIDLLNETDIIEIKIANKWKSALGQILAYADDYPNHKKWIYLFDGEFDINVVCFCSKFDISVKYV